MPLIPLSNMAVHITPSDKLLTRRKGAVTIDGVHTDVICTAFEDKFFIVFTQFEKLGTLVLVTKDTVMDASRGEIIYTTNVLLGKDEPEHHVIARGLASKIPTRKAVLFSLGLKDTSPKMLQALSTVLTDFKCW